MTPSNNAEADIWRSAAEALGWEYQPAYGGYTRMNYHPGGDGSQFSHYPSDVDAQEACDLDGIETLDQAKAVVAGVRL